MGTPSLFNSLSLIFLLSVGAAAQHHWGDPTDYNHFWEVYEEQPSQILPGLNPSHDLHYENVVPPTTKQAFPVIDYHFSCDVLGFPKVHDLASAQPILGEDWTGFDLSTQCNHDHNGVTSNNLLQSEKSIATLRQWFLASNAKGYSFELWMTPNVEVDSTVSVPVLVIGNHHENGSSSSDQCLHNELYVGLRSNVLEVRYVDNDPDQSCRVLLVDNQPLDAGGVVQIVLTMSQHETIVYLNGEQAMPAATNHNLVTNMTTWDAKSTVKLFSDQPDSSNRIILHQVSLYDEMIEAEWVQWGYQQKSSGKQGTLLEHEPVQLKAVEKPVSVVQGTVSPFEIGGWNISTPDYGVAIEILSLPSAGTILGDDGSISEVGCRISLPESSPKTTIMYRANLDEYFTSPGFSYNGKYLNLSPDGFEFRLIALDREDGSFIGWSDTVMKEITIQHVNQPATLILPKVAKLAEVQDFGRGGPIAIIDEVELRDPDLNVDLVRVDIWTFNGAISIQDYVDRADFNFQSNSPEVSWYSHGNPDGSQNMTFVAEPDDVSLILSSIRYDGSRWGHDDTIIIIVYDGVGGPCLDKSDRKYDSVGDECFKIVATVSVPAVNAPSNGDGIVAQFNLWLALLLVLFSLSCTIVCVQMSVKQLLRLKYWKETETDKGNQGADEIEESSCDNPELDVVDFE